MVGVTFLFLFFIEYPSEEWGTFCLLNDPMWDDLGEREVSFTIIFMSS